MVIMKLFAGIFILVLINSTSGFDEFSSYIPIENKPGFWSGREHLRASFDSNVNKNARITNGQIATPGQFPYMAFVAINTEFNAFQCGGSIISARAVLTGEEFYRICL